MQPVHMQHDSISFSRALCMPERASERVSEWVGGWVGGWVGELSE